MPTIRSQAFLNPDALDKSEFAALSQQRGQPRLAFQRSPLLRRKSHRKQQGALHRHRKQSIHLKALSVKPLS
jgi:hypothetical protein